MEEILANGKLHTGNIVEHTLENNEGDNNKKKETECVDEKEFIHVDKNVSEKIFEKSYRLLEDSVHETAVGEQCKEENGGIKIQQSELNISTESTFVDSKSHEAKVTVSHEISSSHLNNDDDDKNLKSGVNEDSKKRGIKDEKETGIKDAKETRSENAKETGTEDVKETGTEDMNETGTEDVKETGTEDAKETGTEDVIGTGTEDMNETGTEDVKETGTEDAKETGTEDVIGTGTEDMNETGTEDVKETRTEDAKETGTEDAKETGTEDVIGTGTEDMNETGAKNTKETGANDVNETGANDVNETGTGDAKETGTKNTKETGANDVMGTWTEDAKDTGTEDAKNAGNEKKTEESVDKTENEWLDILGNGLLKKKIVKKGKGRSSRPITGDLVEIRCEGKLENGTVVDKSSSIQLVLGDEDVIQAFDLALALMEDQEVALLYTDARYAYGIYGRLEYKPPIPRNAAITYELEIISVREGQTISSLKPEERTLHGDKKRIRGNDLYARGDYSGSINAYKRGLKYLEGTDDVSVLQMKVKCLNNLSAAQLKVKAYAMSMQSLDNVLRLEPDNVKALFRKGKCYGGLGKEEEALTCMKKASMLDPNNKMILQELGHLKSKLAVTHEKEKEMYQRMFQQKKPATDEAKDDSTNWSLVIGSVIVAGLGVVAGLLWLKQR